MDVRTFPTHSLIEPVQTLDQARDVLSKVPAWSVIGFREFRKEKEGDEWEGRLSLWERERLAIIPGLAEADERGLDPRKLIRYRHAEAIALVIEEERRRWQDFPELGLSALSSLVGFTVSYHNNGPDSPPTMSFHSAAFSPDSESDDPAQLQEAQDRAFSMLREVWDKELPESPLHGMLNVLANWDLKEWRADISTSRSTLESMLGPALYAEFLSDEIQTALPQALGDEHSETIRSRPNRL